MISTTTGRYHKVAPPCSQGCSPFLLCCIALLSNGGSVEAFAPTLICPLAPLAPVWAVGKAAIMARKKFWPESEPWPREWEKNDIWFEKSKDENQAAAVESAVLDGKGASSQERMGGGDPPPSCPAYRGSATK